MLFTGVLNLFLSVVCKFSVSVECEDEGLTYGEILHNILVGNITTYENSSGVVDYYNEQPYLASANVSVFSIDNAEVLEGTVKLYEWATLGEKWGDAVFLSHFMLYNGQDYNYLEFNDLKLDLIKLANGNATLFKVWADSSSDEDLAALYRSLYEDN